jgi:4,5-dihydroxyphthalate decarboxylase
MRRIGLTIACWDYDRTRALREGTVEVEGCDVTMLSLAPEEAFFRAFRHAEFDVSELSFSSYMIATSRGTCPYIAIPVFPSRLFRHSGIYVRTDRGIKAPADLKGRTVGIPEYQVTAAVWIRGILEDEYGVKPSDPGTFVVVGSGLFVIALLASVIPARRATRVDPMEALRTE